MKFATAQRSVVQTNSGCISAQNPNDNLLAILCYMKKASLAAFGCLILGTLLVGLAGCGKKQQVQTSYEINGVKDDVPRLQDAFAGSPPELQADVNQTTLGLRYGMYEKSLMALDKLSNNPNLNDTQKKVVSDLIEQMKQLIAKGGPQRPQ